MIISIIHPTRGRSDQAIATMKKWIDNSDSRESIEYIFSVDRDDPDPLLLGSSLWNRKIITNPNKSAIEAINRGAEISSGDILVVCSDDFDCPEHWDTLLLEAIGGKQDFCAKTNDGHQDWLITLPIMDRIYYERFGYVYNPDYSHMFADLEMSCVAWMLGRYIELPLTFKHNHYSLIGQQPDAINRKNNATWGRGRMTFNERLAKDFNLTGDLIPLPQLPKY